MPLIGRNAAVGALQRLVDDALRGAGRLALIGGEAGIGKTATATETARYAAERGAIVVWGACVEGGGVPAYWPWQDVLRSLGAGPLPDTAGDEGWFAAGTAVVDALRGQPVVVVLDDLQWAGASCLRVLDFAARQLRRAPALLVGTYRDVEVDVVHPLSALLGGAELVPLTGLGEADVAELLRPVVGGRADALAPDVTRRTGGNPFFVQQIADLVTAPAFRVPAAVGEAVNRRIARLPQATARLLDVAAVAGADVDAALVAAVAAAPYPAVVRDLEPAVAARVLRPAGLGGYRFEHDLYREVRYQQLGPAVRARTHHAVADALLARGSAGGMVRAGDVAQHYAQAVPDVPAEVALTHVEAAAADAEGRLAYEEAARHWAQAVRLAEVAGAVPAGMRLALADALLRAGDVAAARATYLAVAAHAAPADLARAALGVHQCGTMSGVSHTETITLLGRAVAALEPSALGARVRAALARELADGPDADVPRARALVAEAMAMTDEPRLAYCLMAEHDVEWGPGTVQRRLAIAERMAAAAAGRPDLEFEAMLCRFNALVELADPAAAPALRDLEACAQALGQPHHRYLALSRRAAFTIATGDPAAGERQAAEARALGEAIGEPDAYGVHATQAMMVGQLRGGAVGLGIAGRAFGEPAMPPELAAHERAFRQLAAGQKEAAAATIRAAAGPEIGAMFRWRALAEAALVIEIGAAAGAPDVCQVRYRNLAPYAGGFVVIGGAVAILGPVDLYLGLAAAATGDPAAAQRHLENAATLADRFGAAGFAARARLELAYLHRDRHDAATARGMALKAGEVAGQLGLDIVRDRAVALLQHTRPPDAVFRQRDGTGGVWTLTFAGRTAQLPDAKGLHDLAALLAAPGQEISAMRLAGVPDPDLGADEVLDERARSAYKERIAQLDAAIDAGEGTEALEAERAALIAELAHAYGLGGRPRRLNDPGERARSTVTARIRDTLRRIERVHPALAAHLRASVTTGRSCGYRPDEPVRWSL